MCTNLKPNKDKILTFNTTTMTSFRFITSPNILGPPPPPNYLLFIFRSPLELGGSATMVSPAFKSTSHFLPQSKCLMDQTQVQKPIQVVARCQIVYSKCDQMPDHT